MNTELINTICAELDAIKPTFNKYQFQMLGNKNLTTRWEIAMPENIDLFDLMFEDVMDIDFATRKEANAYFQEYIRDEKRHATVFTDMWLSINSTSLWLQAIIAKHEMVGAQ